jgi:TfoX/Sxy family transcriptional regulator of competence genes
MTADAGLVARIADALEQIGERGTRQRNVFGGRGFLRGRRAFAIVWNDSLVIKLRPDDMTAALSMPGVTSFTPDGKTPSRGWVVVSAEVIADDPQLAEWLRRAIRSIP